MKKEKELRAKGRNKLTAVSLPVELLFYLILGIFCAMCIIPFIFVVIVSFSSDKSIMAVGYSFTPTEWSTQAYKVLLEMGVKLWRAYFNSFLITIVGTAASVLICVLYSYALYRKDFKYRGFFTFFAFFTTMFGGGLAPTYVVCKQMLGMNDNYWALIGPLLVNVFNLIIMRTFFQSSVPEALIESAAIDGSGEWRTLFSIVVPVAKPGIATIALLNALAYWNDWFLALLYIRKDEYIPLQYLLQKMQRNIDFLKQNSSLLPPDIAAKMKDMPMQSVRMAICVFIVLPIACAYPFFQRYIIAGLTIGSVKG